MRTAQSENKLATKKHKKYKVMMNCSFPQDYKVASEAVPSKAFFVALRAFLWPFFLTPCAGQGFAVSLGLGLQHRIDAAQESVDTLDAESVDNRRPALVVRENACVA